MSIDLFMVEGIDGDAVEELCGSRIACVRESVSGGHVTCMRDSGYIGGVCCVDDKDYGTTILLVGRLGVVSRGVWSGCSVMLKFGCVGD